MRTLFSRVSVLLAVIMLLGILTACGGAGSTASPTATTGAGASPTTGVTPTQPITATSTPSPTRTRTPEATPTQAGASGTPVTVDALWFSNDGANVQGGASTVRVSVRGKADNALRVGFFESEVAGSGPQWRAAGWMAVITASLLLGKDPSRYEFSFDVTGRIDGASAGALMTAAVLAGYLGDTIDPTVTMTGTMNPDGTIGPVGGIPQKLEGAAAAGKKIVLVPGGQRYDYDYALGQSVDLVEAGQKLGLEVRLVSDVYAAYSTLTSNSLPRPNSGPQPALPSGAFDKYRAGATNWIGKYQQDRNSFNALPADIQQSNQSYADTADYYAGKADQYIGEGQIAAAYQNAFYAAAWARLAREYGDLDNLYYYGGGVDPMIARVQAAVSAETRFSAVSQRIEAETPRTASDAVAIMDAWSNLSIAQGLIFQAQGAIDTYANTPNATENDLLTTIYSASYAYVLSGLYLDVASDSLTNGLGFGNSPAPKLEVLTAISETLRRGAEANITYFEELIVNPWAEQNGVSSSIAKYSFQQYDSNYLTSVAAVAGAQSLAAGIGSNKPAAVAAVNMGAALTAYSRSAGLIAKYYSLGAQIDQNGSITGYDRESSLADMLDLADQRAKSLLAAVGGEDPVQALYYYDNARLLRQGSASDQLMALTYYWNSAVLAEALQIFTNKN